MGGFGPIEVGRVGLVVASRAFGVAFVAAFVVALDVAYHVGLVVDVAIVVGSLGIARMVVADRTA